jgi:replicative DNA helicase
MDSFIRKCHKLCEEKNIRIFVIDHLQLIQAGGRWNNRDAEIGSILRDLKNLAKDCNVCVIVNSQVGREVERRGGSITPKLSDLRESGSIELEADKVIFLYKADYYRIEFDEWNNPTKGITTVFIAKNRYGQLGQVQLKEDMHSTHYIDFDGFPTELIIPTIRLGELDDDSEPTF